MRKKCISFDLASFYKVPYYLFGSLEVNDIFSSLLNLPSCLALAVIRLWDILVSVDPVCYVLVPSGFVCKILNAVCFVEKFYN